jgi:5-dehydro-2-deoxygluconokinase
MRVFAFDHRLQLEAIADEIGVSRDRIGAFKRLCLKATLKVAAGRPGYGLLCDNRLGRDALHAAAGTGLWIGRPAEWPGSRPLALEPELGSDCGTLREWAREDVVKVLCFCHPDDAPEMRKEQEATVKRLWEASRRNGIEFLLEIIPSKVGPVDDDTACAAITRNDPHARGVVVLGLDASEADLATSLAACGQQPLVKGFAIGRTIFGDAARAWLTGEMTDAAAVAQMADRYARLAALWDQARDGREKK